MIHGMLIVNLDIANMQLGSGQQYYAQNVRGLLQTMAKAFRSRSSSLLSFQPLVPFSALPLFLDLADSTSITALRAEFVYSLYESLYTANSPSARKQHFQHAITLLRQAQHIVTLREGNYRVPVERIAGWGRNTNPTRYVDAADLMASLFSSKGTYSTEHEVGWCV